MFFNAVPSCLPTKKYINKPWDWTWSTLLLVLTKASGIKIILQYPHQYYYYNVHIVKGLTSCPFSGNKRISFEEFLPIFLSIGQKKPIHSSSEGFVDGLRVFDREGNGQISAAELRHVLTGLGRVYSDFIWKLYHHMTFFYDWSSTKFILKLFCYSSSFDKLFSAPLRWPSLLWLPTRDITQKISPLNDDLLCDVYVSCG